MRYPRIVVCLLLDGAGLVKTRRFEKPAYIGDPVNTVRILNSKKVDELVVLDITATQQGRSPSFALLEDIVTECTMPLAYGGGIHDLRQVERLIGLGIEKICVNEAALKTPHLIEEAARYFGSQSVLASVDVKGRMLGRHEVFARRGKASTGLDPVAFARRLESCGVGEILIQSIDRDGTYKGYDTKILREVAAAVHVPVMALGGAGSLTEMVSLQQTTKVAAAAAGSLFVYFGNERGILPNWPGREKILETAGLNRARGQEAA